MALTFGVLCILFTVHFCSILTAFDCLHLGNHFSLLLLHLLNKDNYSYLKKAFMGFMVLS